MSNLDSSVTNLRFNLDSRLIEAGFGTSWSTLLNLAVGASFYSLTPATQGALFPTASLQIVADDVSTPNIGTALQVVTETANDNAIPQAMSLLQVYNPSSDNQGGYINTFGSELLLTGLHGTTDSIQNVSIFTKNAGNGVNAGGTYSNVQCLAIALQTPLGVIQYADGIFLDYIEANAGAALHINNQGTIIKAIQVDGGTSEFDGPIVINTLPPASASAAGQKGEITWDTNFIYVCIATNTWRRAAIATW